MFVTWGLQSTIPHPPHDSFLRGSLAWLPHFMCLSKSRSSARPRYYSGHNCDPVDKEILSLILQHGADPILGCQVRHWVMLMVCLLNVFNESSCLCGAGSS